MATTLDLQLIDTYKLNQIAFADSSVYNSTPTNPSFEITVPGYSKINVTFVPGVVNIYNPVILELSTDNTSMYLPDGVYIVKYSVNPNTTTFVQKSFMRVGYIDSLYKRAFLQIDNDCECNPNKRKELKDQLRDIRLLIDGSVAALDNCDTDTANELYRRAYKFIQNLKLCECG